MTNTKYAPISIPVYVRLRELKNLIESLKKNCEAKYTDLYIFSDAALKKEHEKPIEKIREYIKSITGFQNIYITYNEVNLGVKNLEAAIEVPLSKEEYINYVEEDLIVSKNFLNFMNRALRFYFSEDRVFSVSGYTLPCFKNDYNGRVMFSNSISFWGSGLWARKYFQEKENFSDTIALLRLLNKRKLNFCFNNSIKIFLETHRKLRQGNITPDIQIGTFMSLKNRIQAFPPQSLVLNTGFENSVNSWHAISTKHFDIKLLSGTEIYMDPNIDDGIISNNNNQIIQYHKKISVFNISNFLFYILPIPFFNIIKRLMVRK